MQIFHYHIVEAIYHNPIQRIPVGKLKYLEEIAHMYHESEQRASQQELHPLQLQAWE